MTAPGPPHVLIIGGGQAGAQACQSLRAFGFGGMITLVGDEAELPYQRPPLSKAYLKGEMDTGRLSLKPADWYEENGIALTLGLKAVSIDRTARTVTFEGGEKLTYDALILATGARVRKLPVIGADLLGVHYLRSRADVDAIREAMAGAQKIVLIGAGYIGLETAAACQSLGRQVTVLEAADRVLARVTSPEVSAFFEAQHSARGVSVRKAATVSEIIGNDGVARGVKLASGETIDADLIIVGIGIEPNVELAKSARLQCEGGILVGGDARTSDPRIFAIGDCASRPLELCGRQVRLESVHNAIEQAKQAGSVLCGRPRPKYECPWFWSDQFDLKLQIAGLSTGYDDVIVKTGDGNEFTVFYFQGGDLIAVDAVNAPAHYLFTKKALETGARVRKATIADPSFDVRMAMKSLRPAVAQSKPLDLKHIDH